MVGESAGSPRMGPLAFGAPGLHSAGVDSGGVSWPAIAIVATAALLALVGSQLRPPARGRLRVSAAIDLGDALADIATALRVPVLLAAVLILLLCALELGRFGAELWRRRVRARHFDLRELTTQAIADPTHASRYAYSAPDAIAAET